MEELRVPFVDVNSEKVKVNRVFSGDICKVSEGDFLVEFETSKVAVEFSAPKNGIVRLLINEQDEISANGIFAIMGASVDEVKNYRMQHELKSNVCNQNNALKLSQGSLLELVRNQVSEKDFIQYLRSLGNQSGIISRKKTLKLLASFVAEAPFSEATYIKGRALLKSEIAIQSNLRAAWNQMVPLWISTTLDARSILEKHESFSEKNGLAGTLTEISIWAAVELVRENKEISTFVSNGCINEWREKAVAVVVKNKEGGLLLPTLKARSKKQSKIEVADLFFEMKKRVIMQKLTVKDFSGGGLVLSVLEDEGVCGFNALPAPNMSFALAVAAPLSSTGIRQISITLTYDHCCVDGQTASKILKRYVDILKS